jgi:hypothetical protein
LPVRTYSVKAMGAPFEATARSLDEAEPLCGKTLVFVSGPDFFTTSWAPLIRQSLGLSIPEQVRILATTQSQVAVTREDEHTLRLRAPDGMLTAPLDRVLRSRTRPFRVADRFVLSDWRLEVTAVTDDGRPAELLCRSALPLEDPSMTWVAFTPDGYQRFVPPAVGETTTLEGHALTELLNVRYRPASK